MEAEGDLQPFDSNEMVGGSDDVGNDISDNGNIPQESSPSSNGGGFEDPPPLSEDNDLQFSDNGSEDGVEDDQTNETSDVESEKLSENANNILNQRLYQKMVNRNDEIDEILKNLQIIVPSLPFEVVKSNDVSVNRLKTALSKGKSYVINKFVESKYGENLLFYEKLDSLYTLLLDNINTNLKKIN